MRAHRLFGRTRRPLLAFGSGILGAALLAAPAAAVPLLQLYMEGATYVGGSEETWVFDGDGSPVRLWAIGNVAGEGGKGTIKNVRLSIAYDSFYDALNPQFTLVSSTTNGFGNYTDPSAPQAATHIQTRTDGSVPKLSDGKDLPQHGHFGAGVSWQEFALGDFTLTDSEVNDFITSFPPGSGTLEGQINVYEISVTGLDPGATVHFDLYDGTQSGTKVRATFAPFSHDALGFVTFEVPEPSTLAILGVGLMAVGAAARWRRRAAR